MGRIVVTDDVWFEFLKQKKIEVVNFWRKDTRNVNDLKVGDKVFFLVKNSKNITGERLIRGYGLFSGYNVYSIDEAWDKYKMGNGCRTKEELLSRMNTVYDSGLKENQIGCIELTNFHVLKTPILPSSVKINFPNNIVNAKGITSEDEDRILSLEK